MPRLVAAVLLLSFYAVTAGGTQIQRRSWTSAKFKESCRTKRGATSPSFLPPLLLKLRKEVTIILARKKGKAPKVGLRLRLRLRLT